MLPPAELFALGFAMVAYPTSLIFRVARTIERALADIKAGKPVARQRRRRLRDFKDITGYDDGRESRIATRRADRGAE